VRESSPFLFASVSRQSPHPYRWDATWFVVLLIASVWFFIAHEMVLGYVCLLLAGLDGAGRHRALVRVTGQV